MSICCSPRTVFTCSLCSASSGDWWMTMVPPRHTHLSSVLTFWWFQFSTTRVDGSRLLPNGLVWKPLPFFTSNASRLDLKENCSRWKLPLMLQRIFIYLYKKKLGWMRHISQWAMGHNIWPKQKQSLSEMTATSNTEHDITPALSWRKP